MAWPHSESANSVSVDSTPTRALNHRRSPSASVISERGAPKIWAATRANSSNDASAGVSRIPYSRIVLLMGLFVSLTYVYPETRPYSGLDLGGCASTALVVLAIH